jgi:hypothetical protein
VVTPAPVIAARVARLHAAGMASSDNGRPAVGPRQLRAGLRLVDPDAAADPTLAELRGRLLISLAWAEAERGRVEVGYRLLDEAEPHVTERQRPVLLAQRALILKRAGRDDIALRHFDRAIALLSEEASPLDLVKALLNRSVTHLNRGRVGPARTDLRRCLQIAERHGLSLHAALSRVNLSCLDVIAGDLPAALRGFAAAMAQYRTLAPGRLPALAVERARALVAAGRYVEADTELAFAVEQTGRQRLSHVHADALQVRAEAALLAGRPEASARCSRQARAYFLGRGNVGRATFASLLELRADFATADLRRAATIGTRAAALAARLSRLDLPEDARVAGLVAARALLRTGRLGAAARVLSRYRPPGRVDRLDTRLLWRLTNAELAVAAGRPATSARHLRAGVTTLHRHRARFGSLDLQTGAAVHGLDLLQAGLAAALDGGQPATIYRWAERARAQALLLPVVRPPDDPGAAAALEELRQTRYAVRAAELAGRSAVALRSRIDGLQRTLREHTWSTPGSPATTRPPLASFTAVKDALGDAAMVIYLRRGDTLSALVVVDHSATLVRLGGYEATVEALQRLRADFDAQAGRVLPARLASAVMTATRRDAAAVAEAVLDPVLGLVGDRELVVVPTGALITTPWAVLPGCCGRPVTVAPSATVWHAARHRHGVDGRPHPDVRGAGLLVAGPGNDRGDAEIRAIAAVRPHSTVLSGPAATPAATLAALGGAAVAHIAAHGHHQAENAHFSTIDLAGGPLLGYDLGAADRVPPLVVLSSCDLGLADVRPGDETLGMVTALLNAGASTVVASVARVADDAAMTAMTTFHDRVVAGRSPAAALAAATRPEAATRFVCFGAG